MNRTSFSKRNFSDKVILLWVIVNMLMMPMAFAEGETVFEQTVLPEGQMIASGFSQVTPLSSFYVNMGIRAPVSSGTHLGIGALFPLFFQNLLFFFMAIGIFAIVRFYRSPKYYIIPIAVLIAVMAAGAFADTSHVDTDVDWTDAVNNADIRDIVTGVIEQENLTMYEGNMKICTGLGCPFTLGAGDLGVENMLLVGNKVLVGDPVSSNDAAFELHCVNCNDPLMWMKAGNLDQKMIVLDNAQTDTLDDIVELGVNQDDGYMILRDNSSNIRAKIMSYADANGAQAYFTAGNVGIGTIDPDTKLHVHGGPIKVTGSEKYDGAEILLDENETKGMDVFVTSGTGYIKTTNETMDLVLGAGYWGSETGSGSDNTRFVLKPNGDIGIGTDNPEAKLQFANTAVPTATGDTIFDDYIDYKIIFWQGTPANHSYGIGMESRSLSFNTYQNYRFYQQGEQKFVIANGKVGVGTAHPTQKFQVSDDEYIYEYRDTITQTRAVNQPQHLGYRCPCETDPNIWWEDNPANYQAFDYQCTDPSYTWTTQPSQDGAGYCRDYKWTSTVGDVVTYEIRRYGLSPVSNDFVVTSGGNVGIGMTDPGTYRFNVDGDTMLDGNVTVTDDLKTDSIKSRDDNVIMGLSGGELMIEPGDLTVHSGDLKVSNGKVGIGTTSPVSWSKVDIVEGTGSIHFVPQFANFWSYLSIDNIPNSFAITGADPGTRLEEFTIKANKVNIENDLEVDGIIRGGFDVKLLRVEVNASDCINNCRLTCSFDGNSATYNSTTRACSYDAGAGTGRIAYMGTTGSLSMYCPPGYTLLSGGVQCFEWQDDYIWRNMPLGNSWSVICRDKNDNNDDIDDIRYGFVLCIATK